LLARLDEVRSMADTAGWGVKDAMDKIWAEQVVSDESAWNSCEGFVLWPFAGLAPLTHMPPPQLQVLPRLAWVSP
jgi:hypothetical protein